MILERGESKNVHKSIFLENSESRHLCVCKTLNVIYSLVILNFTVNHCVCVCACVCVCVCVYVPEENLGHREVVSSFPMCAWQ